MALRAKRGEWFHRDARDGDGVNFDNLGTVSTLTTSTAASEAMLWNALRDRRFRGIKFRRQHVLCPFIVDFFAPSLKLVGEVDGGYHAARAAEDTARDAALVRLYGARVVRFDASRIERDLASVLRDLSGTARAK